MPRVTFQPSGETFDANDGESLFDIGHRNGIPITTACVGSGTCGLCRVKVVEGEAHLSEYNATEEKHLGNVYFLTKVRLSCQSRVQGGDVTVELAPKRRRDK